MEWDCKWWAWHMMEPLLLGSQPLWWCPAVHTKSSSSSVFLVWINTDTPEFIIQANDKYSLPQWQFIKVGAWIIYHFIDQMLPHLVTPFQIGTQVLYNGNHIILNRISCINIVCTMYLWVYVYKFFSCLVYMYAKNVSSIDIILFSMMHSIFPYTVLTCNHIMALLILTHTIIVIYL